MKLEAFRVQNYKRVHDTGWVTCGGLTVLVGKNEAGKSAILRGLSKIKPSDDAEYDGLREFPRDRYTEEFHTRDWPVASVRLRFDKEDRAALREISKALQVAERAVVTRHFSGRTKVVFDAVPQMLPPNRAEAVAVIEAARENLRGLLAPEGHGDELRHLKEQVDAVLQAASGSLSGPGVLDVSHTQATLTSVTMLINEQWQRECLAPVVDPLSHLVIRSRYEAELKKARAWVERAMPQFIYFDRYDVLDSDVHVPTFLEQLGSAPNAPRVRTTHCLFRHAGLDVEELYRLGQHQATVPNANMRRSIDERAIRTSSASRAMTLRFAEWWQQRQHTFRYQLDGDYLRVWVSDDLNSSEIELDQRSAGMQYFFSFFLVFMVEAEEGHSNSVLLLDEPGTSLHGTAQAKIIKFLRSIAAKNQAIYTTHSPFMIDADHLDAVRPVYEDPADGSTRVSEDVWPKDKDALFPLQAALGYQLAQSLFISKRQVLVEGITDFWILKALDQAVRATGREGLDPSIILTPCGGASRMVPLASMLIGHEVEVVALLDGDEPGRRTGRRLVDQLLGDDNRTVFVGAHTPDGNPTGEIEDLFDEEYFLAAVGEAYGAVGLRFDDDERQIPNIVDRLTALFAREKLGDLAKWRVARALADRVEADPEKVPGATLDAAASIFTSLNALIGTRPSAGGR